MLRLRSRSLFLFVLVMMALVVTACGGGGGAGPGATLPDVGDGGGGSGGGTGGDGGVVKGACTVEEPCVITTIEQLQAIDRPLGTPELIERDEPLKGHYILGQDIDASATVDWHDEQGFWPLGTERSPFEGTLDGNGKKITDLYIETWVAGGEGIGLFGTVGESANIRNVELVDVTVKGGPGNSPLGALVGWNKGTVADVSVTGEVVFERPSHDGRRGAYIGGLIGDNDGTVENASSDIVLTSHHENSGGLVGRNGQDGRIINSYGRPKMSVDHGRHGGLVGVNEGLVEDAHTLAGSEVIAYRASKGNGSLIGGLVGQNKGEIKFSTAAATVVGYAEVGGLVGENRDGGTVEDSSAGGKVTGYRQAIGGLIGDNTGAGTSVARSYSEGTVYAEELVESVGTNLSVTGVGGLVGWNVEAAVVDSYSHAVFAGGADIEGVGGLVGSNSVFGGGFIATSFSTGEVPPAEFAGGLVGAEVLPQPGQADDSFWDTEASGISTSFGGTGKTTAEMKDPATFAEWDDNVWDIQSGAYPQLLNTPSPDDS